MTEQSTSSSTLLVLFCVQLLLTFLTASGSAMKQAEVACDETKRTCRVTFDLEDGSVHTSELIQEESSVFARNAIVSTLSGDQDAPISRRKLEGMRYHTRTGETMWATALISEDGKQLLEGVFSNGEQGVVEWTRDWAANETVPPVTRRALMEGGQDIILDETEDRPWLRSTGLNMKTADAFDPSKTPYGKIIPFFPNCFPQDAVTHVMQINLIVDYGLYQSLTYGMTGTEQQLQNNVLTQIESVISPGKLLLLSQLNIRVEVRKVIISKAADPVPFSRSSQSISAPCKGALSTNSEFMAWLNENNPKDPSGYWIFMSRCFTGSITGVSKIGSYCGRIGNGAVAHFAWPVMFHELGHGIGSSHSFENGEGRTGGLMDYGDVHYKGVIQVHPGKRPEICAYLSYVKSITCPYFFPAPAATLCGDGVLAADEECECLTKGSKSCGKCSKCALTDKTVQCSAGEFLVRTYATPAIVIVEQEALASKECCIRNRFAPPKTNCGPNLIDSCGAGGMCVATCTKYVLSDTPPCGWDESGCLMGCLYKARCRFDFTFTGRDGSGKLASALPDGSSCSLPSGDLGRCRSAQCFAIGSTATAGPISGTNPPQPTPFPTTTPPTNSPKSVTGKPTKAVTARPTKKAVTPKPTKAVTPKPTKAVKDPPAQLNLRSKCANIRNKRKCTRSKCRWCGKRCSYDPCSVAAARRRAG